MMTLVGLRVMSPSWQTPLRLPMSLFPPCPKPHLTESTTCGYETPFAVATHMVLWCLWLKFGGGSQSNQAWVEFGHEGHVGNPGGHCDRLEVRNLLEWSGDCFSPKIHVGEQLFNSLLRQQ